jgi:hypothetical protein
VSTRTPYRDHFAALSVAGRRASVADCIPTVEEAERRMAAAGPSPFLTPEAIEALGQAEEAAGGWLVGPAVYRPQGD